MNSEIIQVLRDTGNMVIITNSILIPLLKSLM